MWIKTVTAHAFSRFKDADLELGEGMTVVFGPNESGKSTWHAAIYAGLCGMRRGPGRTKKDSEFERRFKPWGQESWEVTCVVETPGGTYELRQDLARRQGSAVDSATGREVAGELMNQNAPDGSRLLGLTRETFLSVASVRQAEILSVKDPDDVRPLQQHLERAAATSGTGETASEALAALDAFKKSDVGLRRANATRPLQSALKNRDLAARRLQEADDAHNDWLERSEKVSELQAAARRAARVAREAAAADALHRAEGLDARVAGAREIADRYPSPPERAEHDAVLTALVATAVRDWEQRPHPVPLQGESSAEIGARLAVMPEFPDGDLEVDSEVRDAHQDYQAAMAAKAAYESSAVPDLPDLTRTSKAKTLAVVGVGSMLLSLGAGLLNAGQVVIGLALLGIGLISLVSGLIRRQRLVAEEVHAHSAQRGYEAWTRRKTHVEELQTASADRLSDALLGRGVKIQPGGNHQAAYRQYEADCRSRAQKALAAAGREGLERSLEARRAAETTFAAETEELNVIREGLTEVVAAIGIDPAGLNEEDLAGELVAWQLGQSERLANVEAARNEMARLESILGGMTIEELAESAERERQRASSACEGLDPVRIGGVVLGPEPGRALKDAETKAHQLELEAEGALRDLKAREEGVPSVAEASENLEVAEAELARVESLEEVLDLTIAILTRSQERANKNIAPVLAERMSARLASITGGRYTEVKVDPETLVVRVRDEDGELRDADTLSHGTAEQIYLLLRVAMAEVLTAPGTRCPLLLDDPTVHSDTERTRAVLEVLREVSAEHQIVLFSQEMDVARWARQNGVPVVELT